ncbi:membrane bound O-acyl transferase family protein [Nitzschia inconspicua]|uniref:Membrane bound O-acyl transferase family protein n=1 Tax=Nitzschia inconspicua TaxID=303405 RepID=A0A9K3L7W5_9STRA|nr:membrane bound O-acyl transferase family protein [Nitzschia inconspicua]
MNQNNNNPWEASWDSFENDVREEAFSFHLPIPKSWIAPFFSSDNTDDVQVSSYLLRVGVIPLSVQFWIQTFGLLCLQSLMNIVVAVVVYYTIVEPQMKEKKLRQQNKQSTTTIPTTSLFPYIFGYGVICPLLLAWPFVLFQNVLEMYNIALMLCLTGAIPNLLLLRVTEAIHGLLPDFCYHQTSKEQNNYSQKRSSLTMLILYYSATLQIQFDTKTQQPTPMTRDILWEKIRKFLSTFLQTSLLFSLLLHFEYHVFPEPNVVYDESSSSSFGLFLHLWYFLHPLKLANAFLMASLLSLVLDGGASGLGLLFALTTGLAMEDFSDSPLTQSTSPSDFWGRRWDKPVESALKRGCFRPLRQAGYSRNTAALMTFMVSGFIHEFVLYFMSLRQHSHSALGSYDYSTSPTRGRQCLFFIINGVLLVIERLLDAQEKSTFFKRTSASMASLPRPLRTVLVLLLVLPIGHWFTDEYIQSSFFADTAFGFPIIKAEVLKQ